MVHPSNEPLVMAGQGTIGLELLEQLAAHAAASPGPESPPLVDAVVVPVGGGGMISGIAMAIKSIDSRIRVLGAEPAIADDAFRSLRDGRISSNESAAATTVADGLRTVLGSHNFPIIRDYVDGIVRVSEDDILRATRVVWERLKLCIEPSAGTGVAALFTPEIANDESFRSVAVVLCGGNVDLSLPPAFLGVPRWDFETSVRAAAPSSE